MTPREHRDAKKKWKVHCTKYRSKKKVLANITNSFIKENTPDSDASASCQMVPEVVVRNNKNKEKMLRYRIKKKRDEEIKELKRKVLKYKKRLSRLKSTIPKPTDTPNRKLQKMADNPESRKDLVKKALFGKVLKQQIEDNFSEMKTVKEKRLVVKLLGKTNMEYRYVSIIDKIDEEDGEIRVTFLKLCDNKGQLFRYDADDVSDITMDQVVQKLSNPNIVLKGNRIFYKFDLPVDVFEKK
ncbi:hypothetical protein EVAR_84860_1 [Eumeta japonica]|uniref:Uncharacterized protein n=1 Tax=Eumeta variegata TaxID=151549 RepID=A0A4C1Z3C0_EUMVA|nr:hypothetical protein EVAR_84860_1 [Eumeta japonica]